MIIEAAVGLASTSINRTGPEGADREVARLKPGEESRRQVQEPVPERRQQWRFQLGPQPRQRHGLDRPERGDRQGHGKQQGAKQSKLPEIRSRDRVVERDLDHRRHDQPEHAADQAH
jgi:hypothetical protein